MTHHLLVSLSMTQRLKWYVLFSFVLIRRITKRHLCGTVFMVISEYFPQLSLGKRKSDVSLLFRYILHGRTTYSHFVKFLHVGYIVVPICETVM